MEKKINKFSFREKILTQIKFQIIMLVKLYFRFLKNDNTISVKFFDQFLKFEMYDCLETLCQNT